MDLNKFLISLLVVFALSFVVGLLLSLLASQMQCSKMDIVESAKEGTVYSAIVTIFYSALAYFPILRNPFKNTLENYFNVSSEHSTKIAIGYVLMILSWPLTVNLLYSIEKNVCKPDVSEMNAFKKKLMSELEEKQKEEKDNEDEKKI